jgi:hypothetical protein
MEISDMPTTIALARPVQLAPVPKINPVTCFVLAWAAAMLTVAICAHTGVAPSAPDPFELMAMF